MQILHFILDLLNENLSEWVSSFCGLTSPLGDSDPFSSLRTQTLWDTNTDTNTVSLSRARTCVKNSWSGLHSFMDPLLCAMLWIWFCEEDTKIFNQQLLQPRSLGERFLLVGRCWKYGCVGPLIWVLSIQFRQIIEPTGTYRRWEGRVGEYGGGVEYWVRRHRKA